MAGFRGRPHALYMTRIFFSALAIMGTAVACNSIESYQCDCQGTNGSTSQHEVEALDEAEAQDMCDDIRDDIGADMCLVIPEDDGSGGSGGSGNVEDDVESLIDQLKEGITDAIVDAVAAELCEVIDDNPNYTSNTVFGTGGKAFFADLARAAYNNSAILRDYVQASGYWAASAETMDPDTIITQTENSCMTNIGFVNSVCYATGPQYLTNGSYRASDAPNSGGCDEEKLASE